MIILPVWPCHCQVPVFFQEADLERKVGRLAQQTRVNHEKS